MKLSDNANYREYTLALMLRDLDRARVALDACLIDAEIANDMHATEFFLLKLIELLFRNGKDLEARSKLEKIRSDYANDPGMIYEIAEITYRFMNDIESCVALCNELIAHLIDFQKSESVADFSRNHYMAKILSLRAKCAIDTTSVDAAAADVSTALALCPAAHFTDAIEVCKTLVERGSYLSVAKSYLSSVLSTLAREERFDEFRASIESYLALADEKKNSPPTQAPNA